MADRKCKKHGILLLKGADGSHCVACDKIKATKKKILEYKSETSELITKKEVELKKFKESRATGLQTLIKSIGYYESNAQKIYENEKKEAEEINKIPLAKE